jgi:hypothetical protein
MFVARFLFVEEQMDKALVRGLRKDFPELFAGAWGFPGDGWEPLIRQAAEQIDAIINEWWEGLEEKEKWREPPSAAEIKEKYGGLRFYMGVLPEGMYDEVQAIVDRAESLSLRTCESCGDFGVPRGGGWIKTLCDDCAEDDQEPLENASVMLDYALWSRDGLSGDELQEVWRQFHIHSRVAHKERNAKWMLRRAIVQALGVIDIQSTEEELAQMLREEYGEEYR